MPTAQVNDIEMYYEIHGDGPWLVLIAGLGVDLSIFQQSIDELAKQYKVLVFDNRGVGKTDKPDVPYSIQMMADDTFSLLASLGIKRALVLGLSMGGRIAMELTLSHPEMTEKLILVSTSSSLQAEISPFVKMIKRVRSLRKSDQPYYAFIRQLKASSGYDCTGRLKEISAPALIVYGKNDKLVTASQIDDMKRNIKNSELASFSGGHLFFLLKSEQFTARLLEFLSE